MTRRLEPGRLVIASHNQGKIREIAALLGPFGIEPVSAASLDLPEPDETGTSFIANAELKAMLAADLSGLPALADDSGLCVEALGGDPGIFSARWAGGAKDFGLAMQRVWQEVSARGPDAGHGAYFICALCVAWPDGHTESFEGRVDGSIVWPPRGDQGFGYDPFFVPVGHDISFGEMEPEAKHAMSHRAHAFAQLKDRLL
ncbi:MAG TPA: RdgB/HAM1 family non-canonical purine NTP pyrophosphatase [Sphingobium sp.]